MGLELITRSIKRSYEERKLIAQNGIDKLLFPELDEDTSAGFLLDTYVSSPYGVAYRDLANPSVIRRFVNGSGQKIVPPIASEKTPIDEELLDQIISGGEATEAQATRVARMIDRIVGDHIEGHNMTRWKQALDVLRTGNFYAYDSGGNSLGLDIDFSREAGNSLTYDFTTGNMVEALEALDAKMSSKNTPASRRVVVMGATWLNNFGSNTTILTERRANDSNVRVEAQMEAPELFGTMGLVLVSRVRVGAMVHPVYVCTFQPGTSYVGYKGATATAWVPDAEALAFSLDDRRYRINRGVNALDEMGGRIRVAGDLVVDRYVENDPVTEFVRSQTRHCYVPANVNHTFKSTGTFE
jgi:hypothetical protein